VPAPAQPQLGGPRLLLGAAAPVAAPGGLVSNKCVQEELKRTVDQVKEISAAVRKVREKYEDDLTKLRTLEPKNRPSFSRRWTRRTGRGGATAREGVVQGTRGLGRLSI
jgi:hypothetical protein